MNTGSDSGSGMAAQDDLSAAIDRWLADSIITAEQASQMRADRPEPAPPDRVNREGLAPIPRTSRAALVTEALGYVGGAIIVVALGMVAGDLWNTMTVDVRLALVAVLTLILLVAGNLIPAPLGATGARLRSVLWLASSAGLAALLGIGASEWTGWTFQGVATFTALGTALYSADLWWAHHHLLQQVAVFVALLVGVGTGISLLPDAGALPGLAVWGVSAAWFALSWGGLIPGRHVGTVLAALGLVAGATSVADQGWGVFLALATVSALIGLALTFRDLYLLGAGAIGTLFVLPPIMGQYFQGALAPGLVLLGLGALLVVAAVLTTRGRGEATPGGEPRWAEGTRRSGMLIAAVTLLATSAVVVVAGVTR